MEEQGYFDQGGAKMMELAPDSSIGDVLRRALSKETSARARWAQVENHFESAATPSAKVGLGQYLIFRRARSSTSSWHCHLSTRVSIERSPSRTTIY